MYTNKTFYQAFSLCHKLHNFQLQIEGKEVNQLENSKYLGMYLDQKLTWKKHIEKTADKATKRCQILKRLARTRWGCSRSVLNSTYKAYIKPVILYGCGNLVTAPTATLNKLEKVQNTAMRLITGAVKSTPITAMQIITKNNPITQEINKKALLLYDKLIQMHMINTGIIIISRRKKYCPKFEIEKIHYKYVKLSNNLEL